MSDKILKLFTHAATKAVFLFLASFLITLFLLPYSLRTPFGLIDDHSIMHYLGPDKKVNLTEIPKLILSTEVGQFGNYERYRPSYYFLQVTESFLWGDSSTLWYGFRLIMFSSALMICWFLVSRLVGLGVGLLFILYILTYQYWADIFARLGPAEIYGVFGLAFYSSGFLLLYQNAVRPKLKKWRGITLLSLGFIISVGTKENFIILILPTLILFFKHARYWKKNKTILAILSVLLIFSGLIATSVVIGTLKIGHDIYQKDISSTSRVSLIINGSKDFMVRFKVIYIGLLTLLLGVLSYKDRKLFKSFIRIAKKLALVTLFLLLVYVSQYVFYYGNYPVNIRYDFPGMLVGPLLLLVVFAYIVRVLKLFYPPFNAELVNRLLGLLLITLILIRGYSFTRDMSKLNYERAKSFSTSLSRLIERLESSKDKVIVFDSYNTTDYEPIFSVQRYLDAYGVQRQKFIVLHDYSANTASDPLGKSLATELSNFSRYGSTREGFVFTPLNQLDDKTCVSIIFSTKKKKNQTCSEVHYL